MRKTYVKNAMQYLAGDESLLDDPIASPFWITPAQLKGAPPMLFSTSSTELIAGDSQILAIKAAKAGVQVQIDMYPGTWHVFPMYTDGCGSKASLWQGKHALKRTGQFLKRVREHVSSGSNHLLFGMKADSSPSTAFFYTEPTISSSAFFYGEPFPEVPLPVSATRSDDLSSKYTVHLPVTHDFKFISWEFIAGAVFMLLLNAMCFFAYRRKLADIHFSQSQESLE
jgi:hypothetical protein